jgi:DNA-binding transcriptional LysR family regulator
MMTGSRTRIDLNLVRVFVTIYEAKSVTAAAERLFLTQPSVSYALSKLRDALHDPLFVRGQDGMVPTMCGELTYKKFSAAIASIDSAVELTKRFDPETSSQRFRLAMSDIGELIFLPPILQQLQREAPNVELEVVQVAVSEVAGWLAAGKVDAAIGNLPGLMSSEKNIKLFSERYVCLLRKKHSTIGDALSLESFIAAKHILVSSPFSGHRLIEDILRQHGVSRKVALQIPHFSHIPQLVANTDLLVTLPSTVGRLFESTGFLRTLDIPVDIPHFEVRMFWHEHQEEKASHRWLRNMIFDALSELSNPSGDRSPSDLMRPG